MGQITEGSMEAQNIVKHLIDVILGEVMKIINERTEPRFDSFENLRIQSFGDEEILVYVKPERMSLQKVEGQENQDQTSINDICYQNLPEVCIHSSTLSTQGEGDFQPPRVRETKAFYHLEIEGLCHNDQSLEDSYQSSVKTSSTDDIITQLHSDINNVSFDNIQLSDSEVEKELQTKENSYDEESSQDGEEPKRQVNQCCQTNSINSFEEYMETTKEDNHELRHSPKFSQVHGLLNQYFQLRKNSDGKEESEEQQILSASSEELVYVKSKSGNCVHNFTQTNPFSNPFLCSNVHSTIALSSNTVDTRDLTSDSGRPTDFTNEEENGDNEWIEANEVQISITEPGCSKHFIQAGNVENDVDVVRTKQYWSNVGLITEHNVDRRYLGAVEIPGIESIKGVQRVEEKYLTREPEEIIWVTEPERLEENSSHNSSQEIPKGDNVNYLSFPEKTGKEKKKRRKFVSRVAKSISSIFKFNNKDPK